jgi:four helix bundle protein
MDNETTPSGQRDREPRERDSRDSRDPRDTRDAGRDRISSFEQMKVWQEAHALVLRIFEITPRIPQEQQEGLAALMEKAAIEVPKSIAEGFKRRGSRNKAHYYNLSQSALESLRYLLILCRDLKYDIEFDDLAYRGDQVSRMLDGLIRSMTRTGGSSGSGGRGRRSGRGGGGRGRSNDDIGDEPSSPSDHDESDDWDDES